MADPNKSPWSEWDFPLRSGANRVPNVIASSIFGFNPSISTTVEDIWQQGGILDFLSASETMNIVSTDAQDTAGGNGAQEITIHGLDDDFNVIIEDVVLNGLVPVTTSQSFLRINKSIIKTTGSSQTNEGDIIISSSISPTVQDYVGAEFGRSTKSQFTSPRGYCTFIKSFSVTRNTAQVYASLQVRFPGRGWTTERQSNIGNVDNQVIIHSPICVPPGGDIRVQSVRITATAAYSAYTNYETNLVREEFVTLNNSLELP